MPSSHYVKGVHIIGEFSGRPFIAHNRSRSDFKSMLEDKR
jgi:hypothetical protein